MSTSTHHYRLLLRAYDHLSQAEEYLIVATASDSPYSEDKDLHRITAALYNDLIEDLWKAIDKRRNPE